MNNKIYCMSHYLAFRYIADEKMNFYKGLSHHNVKPPQEYISVHNVREIHHSIESKMQNLNPKTTAVMLSGGIDSAVAASYLPEGSKAYTMKCIVDSDKQFIDETKRAKSYADKYGLEHRVVEIYWSDFEDCIDEICHYDNVPFHSIEVLINKVLKTAKQEGIETMCLGESFDLVFGGMDKLLAKDWGFDEFVKRYTFLEPSLVLKEFVETKSFFEPYRINHDKIDFLRFMDEVFAIESSTSYYHMFTKNNMQYLDPCSNMKMAVPLDLTRVRNGEPKYLVRELFAKRYPNFEIPDKIPMPRAMDIWLASWQGVKRHEFIPNCHKGLSGDQKWQLYCLERFLDLFEKSK